MIIDLILDRRDNENYYNNDFYKADDLTGETCVWTINSLDANL